MAQKKEKDSTKVDISISIEEAFSLLDETVKQLESDTISLEDSFVTYKKGMEILKLCNDKIDAVEKKVMILNKDGELDEF